MALQTFYFDDDFELNALAEPSRWDTSGADGYLSFAGGDLILDANSIGIRALDTSPFYIKNNITAEWSFTLTADPVDVGYAYFAIKGISSTRYAEMRITTALAGNTLNIIENDGGTQYNSGSIDISFVTGAIYWFKIVEDDEGIIRYYYRKDADPYTLVRTSTKKPFKLAAGCYLYTAIQPFTTPPVMQLRVHEFHVSSRQSVWEHSWFGHMNCDITDSDYYGYFFSVSGWLEHYAWPPSRLWNYASFPTGDLLQHGYTNYKPCNAGQYCNGVTHTFYPDVAIEGDFTILTRKGGSYGILGTLEFKINNIPIVYKIIPDTGDIEYEITINGSVVLSSVLTPGNNLYYTHITLEGNTLTFYRWDGTDEPAILYQDTNFLESPAQYITTDLADYNASSTDIYYYEIYYNVGLIIPRTGDIDATTEQFTFDSDMSWASPNVSTKFVFNKSALTGNNSESVDGINPDAIDGTQLGLTVGNIVWVIEADDTMSFYELKSQSGQTQSLPEIIIPAVNAGDWYWELMDTPQFSTGDIYTVDNLGTTPVDLGKSQSGRFLSHQMFDDNDGGKWSRKIMEVDGNNVSLQASSSGKSVIVSGVDVRKEVNM